MIISDFSRPLPLHLFFVSIQNIYEVDVPSLNRRSSKTMRSKVTALTGVENSNFPVIHQWIASFLQEVSEVHITFHYGGGMHDLIVAHCVHVVYTHAIHCMHHVQV